MLTLHEIQHAFKEALSAAPRDWNGEDLGLRDQPPVPLSKRVGIYHYAYAARVGDSLKEDYESLLQWIDEDGFDELVRAYLREFPSVYHTIAEASRHFPEFLDSILQPGDPKFLPDLARYEWACTCAAVTSTQSSDVIPLPQIGEHPTNQVLLALNPSLELFTSEWPVDRLTRRTNSVAFREIARLAIYQWDDFTHTVRLRSRQWELLARIEAGETLEEVLGWMAERRITPLQTRNWFTDWASRGIIQGFRFRK